MISYFYPATFRMARAATRLTQEQIARHSSDRTFAVSEKTVRNAESDTELLSLSLDRVRRLSETYASLGVRFIEIDGRVGITVARSHKTD